MQPIDIEKEVREMFEGQDWHSGSVPPVLERQELRQIRPTPPGIPYSKKVYIGGNEFPWASSPQLIAKQLYEFALSTMRIMPDVTTNSPFTRIELPLLPYHRKQLEKLLKLLIHSITLINITYRMKAKNGIYQSTREDYINALGLMKDLCRLYQEKRTTYEKELTALLLSNYKPSDIFTRKQLEGLFGYCKSQTSLIVNYLEERGIIQKAGGSRYCGYQYRLSVKDSHVQ